MNTNRFTEKVNDSLQAAQSRAASLNHQFIDIDHLLLALIEQENGIGPSIVTKAGSDTNLLKSRLEEELAKLPHVSGPGAIGGQLHVTAKLGKLLAQADEEAKRLKDDFVSVEHILLAASEASSIFKDLHLTRERIMAALREVRGSQRVTTPNPEATYEALEKYGRDLTKMAAAGKVDPVIGRDDEIRRVIQVLSRRTKNNPVLDRGTRGW